MDKDLTLDRIRAMLDNGHRTSAIEAVELLVRQLTATEILLQQKVQEVDRLRQMLSQRVARPA